MKNLKPLREAAKYTQNELAELVGVTRITIARYEAGNRQPSIETLIKLATVLKVTLDVLLIEDVPVRTNMVLQLPEDENDD